MKITSRTRLSLRINNLIFMLLLLTITALLAWLSTEYVYQADWTRNAKHTLTHPSQMILKQFSDPIEITVYIENDEMNRKMVADLIAKYQREKHDITIKFIDPYTVPDKTKSLNIKMTPQGKLFAVLELRYQNRIEIIQQLAELLTEQEISKTLQRLARNQKHHIAFLQGHGERKPSGKANHDLNSWAQELASTGFEIQSLNLSQQTEIPENIELLVIANPQVNLLTGEIDLIKQYVEQGRHLLWMLEPNESLHGLEPLAELLNLTLVAGVLVDPNSWVGSNNPGMLVLPALSYHSPHEILANFQQDTLFPNAVGLQLTPSEEWETVDLLTTAPEIWSETNTLEGEVLFNQDQDIDGPLTIAIAITRNLEQIQQRILLLGDGDFISNTFIGNGGNLELSLRMLNWLVQDDDFIEIPVQTNTESKFYLNPTTFNLLAIFFIIILPVSLLITGMLVWLKRRKI